MTQLLRASHRVILAGLLAGAGTLALNASDVREIGERRIRNAGPVRPEAPVVLSNPVYDLHWLRLHVTDGLELVSGIGVTSSRGQAETDDNGWAQVKIQGGPTVPLTLTDRNGAQLSGFITLPQGHAEGLDALVFLDSESGTFEAVVAGEEGPERGLLAAAWLSLEAGMRERGLKLDPSPSAALQEDEGRTAPRAPRTPRTRVVPVEGDDPGTVIEAPELGLAHGLAATILRAQGGAEPAALLAPTTEFEKAGFDLLQLHGLAEGEHLSPNAADILAELSSRGALEGHEQLVLGAELLRQGATLDDSTRAAVEAGMASSGATGGLHAMSVGQPGGPTQLPGDDLPRTPVSPFIIDTFEPDNTPAQCANIPTNGTPQDRGIDPAGDLDYVCFNATCGETITMETGPIVSGGTGDTHFELFDPDGLLIGADDDGAATSLWSLLTVPIDKTGVHVLRVRGFSTSTVVANYRLTVIATPGACDPTLDDSEPNNTSATCSPKVADGTYTQHWLRPLGDEDWFCFDVATCGSNVVIDVDEPGDPDVTARFRLFSPTGVELLNSTATTAQTVPVTSTGTFRVQVVGGSTPGTGPHDNTTDQNTGQYALSINVQPPTGPCDTFEPDSVQGQCNGIPTDNTIIPGHSISPTGDEDWFCFDLACNDSVTITVTPTPTGSATSLRPAVALWGPTSTAAIQTTTGTVNGTPITLTRAANHAGRWYARVMRASTATGAVQTGTYNIQVLRTPGAADPLCDSDEADSDANQCRPAIDRAGGLDSKALFPGRDEDWVCIGPAICGDTITFETFATPPANLVTNTTVDLYLLPNTTTAVATNTDKVTGDQFSRIVYQVMTPAGAGNFVARVRGSATTTTGPYDVAVTVQPGDCPEPDGFEPDNDSSNCNPLTPDGVAVPGHNIFPVGDADYYCVPLTCGQNLDVTVTPTGGSLRPIITLFDQFGVQLGTITSPANGSPVTLSTTDNDAGVASIRVTSSSSTTGNYNISAITSTGTCLFDPREPDNSAAACRFVAPPTSESRSINPATDSDYYCVVLDCGEGVVVTVTPTAGNLRPIIRLDNASGTNLGTATAPAAGDPITLTDAVSAPGIYNIEVDASSGKGLYDISITKFLAFDCIDDYEPDNTRDACRPIATDGSLQSHTLLLHPDEDWVCFDVLECGTRVTVGTQTPVPVYDDADTTVELYGPTNLLVGSATTGGGASHGRLSLIVNEPGTYKARIIPASTAATSTAGGQYDLSVTLDDVKRELIVPPVTQTLLPAFTQLDAQALTPGSGYVMSTGTAPLIDISATGTPLLADGLSAHPVPLGFTFNYYGNNYTTVTEQDNGLISFSDPTWIAGIGNDCIPDAAAPNDMVSVFWEDLQQGVGAAEVYYEIQGAPGSRVCIIQWDQNPIPGGTLVTLQGLLYEGSNDIEFRYGPMTGPAANGNSATVGIENPDGTDGIQFSCNTPLAFSGTSIRFSAASGNVDYPDAGRCYPPYSATKDAQPFLDISATGTPVGPLTDDSFTSMPLPIVFPYFGIDETSVNIGSNGFINFGAGSTSLSNQCTLPSTTVPNGVIAPFWDDLNPATGGAIYQQLFGTPGSGTAFWVVQWHQVPFFSVGGANTFQAILHENGQFEFRYGPMTATTRGSGDSATIGAEDRTGTTGTTYACNTANSIFPGDRILFAPAVQPPRFRWLDPDTMVELGTGPTYLHPIEGRCDVLLQVEVKDPTSCCTLTSEQLVTVPDRAAPTIVVQPSFGNAGCQFMWPPNHGYADFTMAETGLVAVDNCDNGVIVRFSALSSSNQPENENGVGDGNSVDDIMISPDGQMISLRSERDGNCEQRDRTYTVFVEVADSLGNTRLSDPFSICVYHDQGSNPPGPSRAPNDGSSQDDTRPGWTEGGYGTDCGTGCSRVCDPTQR